MDGQTNGGDYNISFAFLKKRGDNKKNSGEQKKNPLFL